MGEIKPPVLVGRNDRGPPDSISSQILKIATRIPVKGDSDVLMERECLQPS
jgi:hypothetical protein